MGQSPRKVLFIDKKFQASFIMKFILLLLAGTALFDVAAYVILNRRLGDTFWSAHKAIQSVGDMLLPALVWLSVAFVIVLGLAVLLMTLLVSHYIAGPLYAIRRYLDFLSEGRLDFDAKLRGKDQALPLAVSLAKSIDTLNGRIRSIQALSGDLAESANKLQERLQEAGEGSEDLRSDAARVAEIGARLATETGYFRTRPIETAS